MELQLSARDYKENWLDACRLLNEREAEIERLRAALAHIECEPINAEYMARAALDGPNASNEGAGALATVALECRVRLG